jgi:serine kinase of HPr protein (carbohydrate metabolism regulator)
MILHAGLIALDHGRGRQGVLITGPSGSGKTSLALACLERDFSLVADDRVEVWTSGGAPWGRAPDTLAGLIEIRGQGVVRQSFLPFVRIVLAIECAPPETLERLPDPLDLELAGFSLPRVRLDPFESLAPAKLRRALIALG